MIDAIFKIFNENFNSTPIIVRSPGRINIIGEHTDYNNGFVLPAAIDKAIYVAINKRLDDTIKMFAVHFNEQFEIEIENIKPSKHWSTYVLGIVDQLQKRGYKIGGFNLVLDGDIPVGAGLSSSAAVECAVVFALNELFNLGIGKMEMVQIAQKAEHEFSGVLCGIMDMFASMFGKQDSVIKLDCMSLEYEYKPLQLKGYKLLLLNTNVKHSLASSAYNTRRQECEQGVAWIKEKYPFVNSLRDATLEMLNECVSKNLVEYTRCKFVIEEIQRLQDACVDLEKGNIEALGKKMFATHFGLSKAYEVSCKELDFLVDEVKNNPNVLGARMMGGGFGGCTLNIVNENEIDQLVDQLVEQLGEKYHNKFGLDLTPYIVKIENGTARIF